MSHKRLKSSINNIIKIPITVTLGTTITNPKIRQNILNNTMRLQSVAFTHCPQYHLARIVLPHTIVDQALIVVLVEEEHVLFTFTRGHFGRFLGTNRFSDSETGDSSRIPPNDQAPVADHCATALDFLDSVNFNDAFAPIPINQPPRIEIGTLQPHNSRIHLRQIIIPQIELIKPMFFHNLVHHRHNLPPLLLTPSRLRQ
mmetsp:Transcript_5429/g.6771  ORF Transcript_5429/g.6771 Transcript_5429/m.6771 type:complete len:200 (+) Transcript_5429:190-789(+)